MRAIRPWKRCIVETGGYMRWLSLFKCVQDVNWDRTRHTRELWTRRSRASQGLVALALLVGQ